MGDHMFGAPAAHPATDSPFPHEGTQLDTWDNEGGAPSHGQPGDPHGGRAGTHSHRTQALGQH